MTAMEGSVRRRCASCGADVTGPFCASCGERAADPESLTLRGFLKGAFTSLTDVERGLWPSLRLLLTRPGFLTMEYLAGRRVRYVRPLRLFLFVNVAYFLLQPHLGSNTYNTTLRSHVERQVYSPQVAAVVKPALAAAGTTLSAFAPGFDGLSSSFARSLILMLAPGLALVLALRYRGRGVPAVGHLVFALHFLAWFLLVGSIAFGALVRGLTAAGWWPAAWSGSDMEGILTLAMLVLAVAYFWPALRRVYGAGHGDAAVTGSVLALLFFPMVFVYRYLLFWITWAVVQP